MALEHKANKSIASSAAVSERDDGHREAIAVFNSKALDCNHGGGHLSLRLLSLCLVFPPLSTCEPGTGGGWQDRYKRRFLAPELWFMRVLCMWRAYRSQFGSPADCCVQIAVCRLAQR